MAMEHPFSLKEVVYVSNYLSVLLAHTINRNLKPGGDKLEIHQKLYRCSDLFYAFFRDFRNS